MKTNSKLSKNKPFSDIFKSTTFAVLIITALIAVVVHAVTGNFFSNYNVSTVIRQISFIALVSFGQTLVLLTGGIDLSVASIAAFCSMTTALLMTQAGVNPFISLFIALALGAILGCLNGLLIHYIKLTPFIVTLATGSVFTGIVYVITRGMPIVGIPDSVSIIGQGMLAGVLPYPTIIMFINLILIVLMLKYTSFGRHIYAIGGNEYASSIVGIRVGHVKVLVYTLSGLLASLAGVLMVLRLASSQVNIGEDWNMPSITAAVLGGTSMSGGSGNVVGSFIGALLMGVLSNSITLLGISSYWNDIVTGIVILVAVIIDALREKN